MIVPDVYINIIIATSHVGGHTYNRIIIGLPISLILREGNKHFES